MPPGTESYASKRPIRAIEGAGHCGAGFTRHSSSHARRSTRLVAAGVVSDGYAAETDRVTRLGDDGCRQPC